jgi:hypothetical protein
MKTNVRVTPQLNYALMCAWCGEKHTTPCEVMQTYVYKDDEWPSRLWNEEGADYVDLSGGGTRYD